MEKNEVIILEDRGFIQVKGLEAKDFLQNIVTNDLEKVTNSSTVFSSILTPQGKYLFDFFIIKSKDNYLIECEKKSTPEITKLLNYYKLRSKVELIDLSEKYVAAVISLEKFKEIGNSEISIGKRINYRDDLIYVDPRNVNLGAKIISKLENLYLTIKKLNLTIVDKKKYYNKSFRLGIPQINLNRLKDKIFGIENNLDELNGIDFKKGCYVGQENTARMKLKNKLRKRLLPIFTNGKFEVGDSLMFNNTSVGNIIISKPYPFGLIKLFDPNLSDFKDKILNLNGYDAKLSN